MAFKPGHKLSKGRPKGAINKRSREFQEILEASGFCPVTALIDIHRVALQRFTEEVDKEDSGRISPMESSAAKYLKIAADSASDVTAYAYPKLKAIERVVNSPLEGMTAAQKLEAFKQAIPLLEAQAKAEGKQ